MTLLERGMSMLGRLGPTAAGGSIIYRRGGAQVWLPAIWDTTKFEVETNGEIRTVHTDRDVIVEWERLIIDGERAIPRRGDRFTVVMEDGGDGDTFEVLSPVAGEPWEPLSSERRQIRIHGKKV